MQYTDARILSKTPKSGRVSGEYTSTKVLSSGSFRIHPFCWHRAVESDFAYLFVDIAANLVAPKAYQGRKRIFEAFQTYYKNRGHEKGSLLAKSRYLAAEKNGTPLEDIAKFELSGLFGMLINTVPCTFWVVLDVFSRPKLLQDLRDELSTVLVKSSENDGTVIHKLYVARMRDNCPLPSAIFQETLRTRSTGSSIRRVRQDFMLADRYLLKKGSMLQMPFPIIHENENLWGKAAREYNPRRFIKAPAASDNRGTGHTAIKPGTFRGFGGGTTLCPGRHFATAEITSVVAMLALRFDILPVEPEEGWRMPTQARNHGATSVLPPKEDLRVRVTRREGFEGGRWTFDVKGLKVGLVSGHEG